ncbi:hypothetical protein E0Z10_g5255 [Xylaria hypoxylon]|uniref:Extradiol ring-cleavage dioxygenase class III enzyme subunit B domain-containing protein n=1 Tax=Xylaria hypoxylon TaxID=37992 RepID=A0A4Z0YU74_9PEZI|nr:hypothetical protein E0Z10_g5255 [Xylaria hypoxylon]
MPVYFLGIGRPSFVEDTIYPAYAQLVKDGASKISIHTSEHTGLVYDFHDLRGFPSHYYDYEYPNRGSSEVAEKVIDKLSAVGIEVSTTGYGLVSWLVSSGTMPYVYSFDEALKLATTANPEERRAAMADLMRRSDAGQVHPTLDHILPIYVSAGAAGLDVGERLWTMPDRSLSWAQYRFGTVPAGIE